MSDAMLANFFTVKVKPGLSKAFVEASILEAQDVVSEEPGVFQFHVMADDNDPDRFYFYEVFQDEAALQDHRETDAYKNWRRAIEPMLEGDVTTVAKMRSIFPTKKGFQAQKPGLLQW